MIKNNMKFISIYFEDEEETVFVIPANINKKQLKDIINTAIKKINKDAINNTQITGVSKIDLIQELHKNNIYEINHFIIQKNQYDLKYKMQNEKYVFENIK